MDITAREYQDRQNEIDDAHDTARRNHQRAMRDAGWTKQERRPLTPAQSEHDRRVTQTAMAEDGWNGRE